MPTPTIYVIRITPGALRDLRRIFNQVRVGSPQNAPTVIEAILNAIDRLDTFPHRYAVPRVGPARDQSV